MDQSSALVEVIKDEKIVTQFSTSEIGRADLEDIYLTHMRDQEAA
jgi:hypothetical protein